ncbi:ATP-grasp domain-containing protein [Streptomyces sp. NPDC052020]|uniref:ATP-grasp domain-containing protein n=1 Tax=Streptomyces sp. NPDC052020 TaxID=3155677 RepID=UPI0034162A31
MTHPGEDTEVHRAPAPSRICVVDGISTGLHLARELRARGVDCGHVASAPAYLGVPRTPAGRDLYSAEFALDDSGGEESFERLVRELRLWGPRFVVAGSEPGVELADRLGTALGIRETNAAATTPWRRDKYAMHERLREAGVPHARQIRTADRAALAGWLDGHGRYPVVVKPVDSSCSDGVQVCEDAAQALAAFDALIGQRNRLGRVNNEVLGQEFLEGTQYFVNTVSWAGAHLTSDIWRLDRRRRPGGAYLFESMTLQPAEGLVESALRTYVEAALDALGFAYGAAHCEVMWTASGPVLVEANARLMGASIDTESFTRALGHTQTGLLAEAYTDPERFRQRLDADPYTLREHLAEASFLFSRSGTLTGFPGRARIKALPSFHSFVGVPEPGTPVTETVDTLGTPGYAYFLHPDRSVVESDARAVRQWQREDSLFTISEEPQP